jgi:hypothetical protein
MKKACIDCKHFTDANYSRTYISPICIVHGGDDAMFMRSYVCGLEGKLYQQKEPSPVDEVKQEK